MGCRMPSTERHRVAGRGRVHGVLRPDAISLTTEGAVIEWQAVRICGRSTGDHPCSAHRVLVTRLVVDGVGGLSVARSIHPVVLAEWDLYAIDQPCLCVDGHTIIRRFCWSVVCVGDCITVGIHTTLSWVLIACGWNDSAVNVVELVCGTLRVSVLHARCAQRWPVCTVRDGSTAVGRSRGAARVATGFAHGAHPSGLGSFIVVDRIRAT